MIRFTTQSGSHYVIDPKERTWGRDHNPASPNLRTLTGKYLDISPIEPGRSVRIYCPPLIAGTIGRVIYTTPVVDVYDGLETS